MTVVAPGNAGGTETIEGTESAAWRAYLADFHAEQPGITEDVLGRARNDGDTPYGWLAEEVPAGARVLDLACGNGALRPRLDPRRYLGVDNVAAELAAARRRGVPEVVRADATRLPLPDGSVDTVVCSMALMLLPLEATLREIRRVLSPGGRLVATLPASRPLTAGDAGRYARLLLALRRPGLDFPNDESLARPEGLFTRAGLRVVADRRRRFAYPIRKPADGRRLVHSLYLPDIAEDRLAAGLRIAGGWVGAEIGIPLRRLTAVTT